MASDVRLAGLVAVVGAGASGLAACKALGDRRIEYVCFESRNRLAGLWAFAGEETAAYRSLHINTSSRRSSFRDYPMGGSAADYPHHTVVAGYLEGYARRFGIDRNVRLGTTVLRVRPLDGGGFRVDSSDGRSDEYRALVVANGHHWDPNLPELPGAFDGVEMHSHRYVDAGHPHDLRGKSVVVVGFGNSAVDIVADLARPGGGAARVLLSARRGAWVLPKYALGRPLDQSRGALSLLPRSLRRRVAELWYRSRVGDLEELGLPRPDHRLGDAHPTVSDELPGLLRAGRVTVRGPIAERAGNRVRFADGSSEAADAIVYATGYRVSFPFFDPEFLSAPGNELPLYLRVFPPDVPGVYFIGLCQPLGPIFPIAEAQARLVAEHLAGRYALPSRAEMIARIAREREGVRRRFGDSPRHTMQVDFDEYLAALDRAAGPSKTRG